MKPKVLVVDDEAMILRLCETAFRRLGVEVLCASSADDAIVKAAAGVDWVLTDVFLGDKDGVWLAEQLRGLYPGLEIVLMTGDRVGAEILRKIKTLKLSLITKPFDLQELEDMARKFGRS
ncbi:MAG: response regulator [Elusimicrobia bacterium]|nr:response regulator [Elusimicrobiota bacterium]